MATKKKPIAKKPAPAAKHAPAKKPVKAPPAKHVVHAKPASTPAVAAKPVEPVAKKSATPFPAKGGSKPPMNAADLKRMLLERKTTPKAAIAFSLDEVREIALKNEKQTEGTIKTGKSEKAPSIFCRR